MKYLLHTESDRLVLELSPVGRAARALISGLQIFAVSLAVMAVFYLPDFLADYGQRSVDFMSFFASFVFVAAVIAAGIAGVMSALATYRVEVDAKRGLVRWDTKTAMGRELFDEMDLRKVTRCDVVEGEGWLKVERVELLFEDGARRPVASLRAGHPEVQAIARAIGDLLDS